MTTRSVDLDGKGEKATPWTMQDLEEREFTLIEWDGRSVLFVSAPIFHTHFCVRLTRKILDKEDRVVAVLVGQPNDPTWEGAVVEAAAVMLEVASEGISARHIDGKYLSHRRGSFVALPVGVSFGGGQTACLPNLHRLCCVWLTSASGKKPGNLVHPKERERLIKKLKKYLSIIRIVGFQSSTHLPRY